MLHCYNQENVIKQQKKHMTMATVKKVNNKLLSHIQICFKPTPSIRQLQAKLIQKNHKQNVTQRSYYTNLTSYSIKQI